MSLSELLRNPAKSLRKSCFRNTSTFFRLLEYAKRSIEANPREGKLVAGVAVRLSYALGSTEKECRAAAYGVLAEAHTSLGDYHKSERCLRVAQQFATTKRISAELYTRQARLHRYRREHGLELAALDRAFTIFSELEAEEWLVIVRIQRGLTLAEVNRLKEAIQETGVALHYLSPGDRLYGYCINNLAFYLSKGSEKDVEQAVEMVSGLYEELKGKRGVVLDRARLRWIDGMIRARLGEKRVAMRRLRAARQTYVRLEMPSETAAISVDLALVEYPNRVKVRRVLRRIRRLEILPTDLREGLARVWDATRVDNPFVTGDPEGKVYGALKAFRETLGEATGIPAALFMPEPQPEPV